MQVSISKSDVAGIINVPPSKSYTIRGLMCSALAKGNSEVLYPLVSGDTEAAAAVLGNIGVAVTKQPDVWKVAGGSFHQSAADLYCGDSAATLRFMAAVCSAIPGSSRLTAGLSLAKRPVEPLLSALRQLGVRCSANRGLPPVSMDGGTLIGGFARLPGDVSSQFISALLLAAPRAKEKVTIELTTPLESKPYVLMTLECLDKFGIKVSATSNLSRFEILPQAYKLASYPIEKDWTSASYFLAFGAVAGEVTLPRLNLSSLQGDKVILDLLLKMGADVKIEPDFITVRKSALHAIQADLSDCIDLLPTMAVVAVLAEGTSEFTGISRARLKESNRVAAVCEGLERMGVPVEESHDKISITGAVPHGAVIDSKLDHRIAMAFGILGTVAGETIIAGAECVGKTFPEFWDKLKGIGGKVSLYGK